MHTNLPLTKLLYYLILWSIAILKLIHKNMLVGVFKDRF